MYGNAVDKLDQVEYRGPVENTLHTWDYKNYKYLKGTQLSKKSPTDFLVTRHWT